MGMELNIKDKLNLTKVDLVAPEVVVREYANQLETITDGIVKGMVESYDGPIESYTTPSFSSLINFGQKEEHDIQWDLGAIGYQRSQFEFYLTATCLPRYRFRILFFEYGIGGYPVKIVLEQGIANAIKGTQYIYTVKSRDELGKLMLQVLSSSKAIEVIQDLINATRIAQSKGVEDLSEDMELGTEEE